MIQFHEISAQMLVFLSILKDILSANRHTFALDHNLPLVADCTFASNLVFLVVAAAADDFEVVLLHLGVQSDKCGDKT